MGSQATVVFRSPDGVARWLKRFLFAMLGVTVVCVVAGLSEVELLSRATSVGISDAEMSANDLRQGLIRLLQFFVFLAVSIAFLVWFHRVHKNLQALGAGDLTYTPAWAVGSFFVPILNLFRPLQVMREVWHCSDPARLEQDNAPFGPCARDRLGTPSLIRWWWALYLISYFLGNAIFRLSFADDPTIGELKVLSILVVISDFLDVAGVLVTVSLVKQITTWQGQRASRISGGGQLSPPTLIAAT